MSDLDAQITYAAWRFRVWGDCGMTYREIDNLVRRGVLQPGMTNDEVRDARASCCGEPDEGDTT